MDELHNDLSKELPDDCVVFYLNEKAIASAKMRKKMEEVDDRTEEILEDLEMVKIMEEYMHDIGVKLQSMRTLAFMGATMEPPFINRDELDKRFQALKNEVAEIIEEAEDSGMRKYTSGSMRDFLEGLKNTLSL